MLITIRKILRPLELHYLLNYSSKKLNNVPLIASIAAATIFNRFNHQQINFIQNSNKFKNYYKQFNIFKRNYSKEITNCWNCKKKITKLKNQFFCENCGSLQDVQSNVNFFHLLSMNEQFNIDSNNLTKSFRQLQNFVHPDKFSNKHEKEQEHSAEWSSLINKAYKTLLDPLNRGEYILKLKGITLPKDNSSLDKEFLMEMMEKNEEIEDANKDNIVNLKEQIQNEINDVINEMENNFSKNNYEQVKFNLIKMRYLKSLEKSIKDKFTKFGIV